MTHMNWNVPHTVSRGVLQEGAGEENQRRKLIHGAGGFWWHIIFLHLLPPRARWEVAAFELFPPEYGSYSPSPSNGGEAWISPI